MTIGNLFIVILKLCKRFICNKVQ